MSDVTEAFTKLLEAIDAEDEARDEEAKTFISEFLANKDMTVMQFINSKPEDKRETAIYAMHLLKEAVELRDAPGSPEEARRKATERIMAVQRGRALMQLDKMRGQ